MRLTILVIWTIICRQVSASSCFWKVLESVMSNLNPNKVSYFKWFKTQIWCHSFMTSKNGDGEGGGREWLGVGGGMLCNFGQFCRWLRTNGPRGHPHLRTTTLFFPSYINFSKNCLASVILLPSWNYFCF